MNFFVADPEWGWWIILYFFFGGIAAGAYFTATLISYCGGAEDQAFARWGFRIAFPLIVLCAVFLTIDLNRPERFWHMLFRSEVVHGAFDRGWPWTADGWLLILHAPIFKYWSPMSIGSWALTVFGLCSFVSFLGNLWPDGRMAEWFGRGNVARGFQIVGCGVAFFVASYTGALVTATNQPLWSDTNWLAPLFLTSAASTGIATLILLGQPTTPATRDKLDHAALWAVGLEAIVLALFLLSLRGDGGSLLWRTGQGKMLMAVVPLLAVIVPLGLHLGQHSFGPWRLPAAACVALVGGFLLRYAVVTAAPELLAQGPAFSADDAPKSVGTPAGLLRISPEDGRVPGGGAGADPGNYVGEVKDVQPRTKMRPEQSP